MQFEMEDKTIIEFRLIDDDELPPIVITMGEDDVPKVIINHKHKIWLSLNRKIIGGISESLFGKIDELLHAYLTDQRAMEKEFGEMV